jgi:GntR family transcriptional regulator
MIDFRLDKNSFVPFYRQLIDMILAGVASGRLLPGERLPTIRDMAVRLEVNPNTVAKAYSQLQIQGVVDTQQGTGVFVRPPSGRKVTSREEQRNLEELCRDFIGRAQLMNIGIDRLIECLKRFQDEGPNAG